MSHFTTGVSPIVLEPQCLEFDMIDMATRPAARNISTGSEVGCAISIDRDAEKRLAALTEVVEAQQDALDELTDLVERHGKILLTILKSLERLAESSTQNDPARLRFIADLRSLAEDLTLSA